MNRAGLLLAGLAVAGYIGFELYALERLGYRTEPLYIYTQFAAADRAVERCGGPGPDERRRFQRNLEVTRRLALDALAEQYPDEPAAALERRLDERRANRHSEVDALIESRGCASGEAWQLVKLHEIKARLNLR